MKSHFHSAALAFRDRIGSQWHVLTGKQYDKQTAPMLAFRSGGGNQTRPANRTPPGARGRRWTMHRALHTPRYPHRYPHPSPPCGTR